jgi:hypothetical protein
MVDKPHKHTKVKNSNGDESFGYLPELKINFNKRLGLIVPSGNIHLYYGNKGFGFFHIWEKHSVSFKDELEIPKFIENILIPGIGTEVFCEEFTGKIKPIVLRQKIGQVVLQYREGREENSPHYSIVTAFPLSFSKNLGKKIGEF